MTEELVLQPDPVTDADRQRVLAAISLASEAVAPFYPMLAFVHHNPLHGLEHLPFDEAIRKGRELTGGNGYLSNEEYRGLLADGRIDKGDLRIAIRRFAPGFDGHGEVAAGGRRIDPLDVLEIHLAFGIDPVDPEAFRELVRRKGVLRESGTASALWPAVLDALDLTGTLPPGLLEPGGADGEEGVERQARIVEAAGTGAVQAAAATAGLGLLAEDLGCIGEGMTAGEWIGRLAGVDIVGSINREMIKWCSAFLDQGVATWEAPGREKGFYNAWRDLAACDVSGRFLGIRGFRGLVKRLPAQPEDALIESMRALGVRDKKWIETLERHLAQLPGWAGFVKWRSESHDYLWQRRYPIELVDYLAVRMFYARRLVEACCRDAWGVEGDLRALAAYFRRHPAEYLARRRTADANVPPDASPHQPAHRRVPASDGAWDRFGRIVHLCDETSRRDPWSPLGRDAWRLFRLAQFLALSPYEVRAMSVRDARALLSILESLPPDAHGPIWLEAHEAKYRGELLSRLAANRGADPGASSRSRTRPPTQSIYCIDVRTEGLRRHLEAVGDHETFGFAGFFGVPIGFRGFGRREDTALCPVLIKPKSVVIEFPRAGEERKGERALRGLAWDGVVHGVVQRLERHFAASYALVDLLGGFFGLSLVGRTFFPVASRRLASRVHHVVVPPAPTALTVSKHGRMRAENLVAALDPPARAARLERLGTQGFTGEEQALYIETGLRTMGLTGPFARLVLVCGHGSESTNNPYKAALDCGACGGNPGGPNARTFATIANMHSIRVRLRERGIDIPEDTRFVAAQHNTTTDEIVILDEYDCPETHREDLLRLRRDLAEAGARQAQERCRRLPGSPKNPTPAAALRHAERRSADLAQVRPEWALSGNAAFVVAHRSLTLGLDLGGRVFLHSYDWERDAKGTVLEIIMTAPLIVGEWINMEHYFSTVDNKVYGADSKVVHNVVGGFGVMLGSGGDLQTGLPRQSVMAGPSRYHDPFRLLAVIEAPTGRIEEIIRRHHILQHLFDNRWVNLVSLDPRAGTFHRYLPGFAWERLPGDPLCARPEGIRK
ncbi:MAG: DUF2309 domain-containing protein [Deltaproteobacteria bacterium]|nr:MAG: DUF2309 domain-containing protein [Deltaproteobacteria bacterium]